jgi:hypothetical protein
LFRRTGQGKILDDDDKHKTKLSTFKPKALRNPKTYKNLENSVCDEGSKAKIKCNHKYKNKPNRNKYICNKII